MKAGIILAVVLIASALVLIAVEAEAEGYTGTLLQVSGVWFLNTGSGMFGLEMPELANEKGEAPEFAVGDSILVKAFLEESVLKVDELEHKGIQYTLGAAEEAAAGGYQVNSNRCIGCRLCVKHCPVGAISMQNGKAVIDVNKCIQCGICANGNGQDFKGCPVGAISKP